MHLVMKLTTKIYMMSACCLWWQRLSKALKRLVSRTDRQEVGRLSQWWEHQMVQSQVCICWQLMMWSDSLTCILTWNFTYRSMKSIAENYMICSTTGRKFSVAKMANKKWTSWISPNSQYKMSSQLWKLSTLECSLDHRVRQELTIRVRDHMLSCKWCLNITDQSIPKSALLILQVLKEEPILCTMTRKLRSMGQKLTNLSWLWRNVLGHLILTRNTHPSEDRSLHKFSKTLSLAIVKQRWLLMFLPPRTVVNTLLIPSDTLTE